MVTSICLIIFEAFAKLYAKIVPESDRKFFLMKRDQKEKKYVY